MTRTVKKFLKSFAKDETGSAVVPFALWTPVFLGLILSAIEMGTVTIRHTALERALDQTVREIRIGQGDLNSHAALKERICQAAAVLPSCTEMLHLEMIRLDMRNWSGPQNRADCVDTSEEVTPNRTFEHATENQTMFLRACFKYRPITPAGTLSSSLQKDDAGYTALISTSAFVTEPS